MPLTPDQVALLERNEDFVEVKRLFAVTFAGTTFRLIEDVVPRQIGGEAWLPAHGWISGGGVDRSAGFVAMPVEYRLAAFPASMTDDAMQAYAELVRAALHDEHSWRDAPISQWMQLFDNGAPVGPPISKHRGFIADVKPVESATEQYLSIRAEDIFSRRNYTPQGEYTDRFRQTTYPGDRGSEFVASLVHKVIEGWLKT